MKSVESSPTKPSLPEIGETSYHDPAPLSSSSAKRKIGDAFPKMFVPLLRTHSVLHMHQIA